MKYDINNYSDVEVKSSMGDIDVTLAKGSESLIFQIFSKNIYSNPIGSVVREITSNCFDSHVEAGVDLPVVIRKNVDNLTGGKSISFIDYGVGMSPERIKEVFSVMFNSTKRDDNQQIGAFGLGSKTPLAYKRSTGQGEGEFDNSYTIITNYNGFKYVYYVYDGNKCPKITEPTYEVTSERNGTEIQIPVLGSDIGDFQREMTKQLYYFENIVFEGFDYPHDYNTNEDGTPKIIKPLSNDYQIIRGKNFLFRGDNYSDTMHVCLGRVAYPIDYSVLGLYSRDYILPIALKLEVGDVNVTVSREGLDYSEATIKMLKKKLEAAKDEIKFLIGRQYQDIQTLEQYFSVKADFGKLLFPNGISLYVGDIIEQKDVDFSNFKYQFMKMPNDKQLFRFFFDTKQLGKKPSRSRYSSSNGFEGSYKSLKNSNNVIYINDEWNRKVLKQAWLKDRFSTYYLISKRKVDDRFMRSEIADLFNVHLDATVDDNGKPVKFVKELLKMQEEYMAIVRENCENYDTLEVPEDFVVSRKRGSGITPEYRKQTIPVKFVGYSKDRVKLSSMFDYNMPIFYGTADDQTELRNAQYLYNLLFDNSGVVNHVDYNKDLQTDRSYYNNKNKKSSIMFIQLAQNNVKHMKHCKKAYHVSEFKVRMGHRKEQMVREYFQTHELIEQYNNFDKFYREGFINRISEDWGAKVDVVKEYIQSISEASKDTNIWYDKDRLSRYYNLTDLTQTPEQLQILVQITEIQELQETNSKTLGFFQIPYQAEELEEEQITIMQLSLAL